MHTCNSLNTGLQDDEWSVLLQWLSLSLSYNIGGSERIKMEEQIHAREKRREQPNLACLSFWLSGFSALLKVVPHKNGGIKFNPSIHSYSMELHFDDEIKTFLEVCAIGYVQGPLGSLEADNQYVFLRKLIGQTCVLFLKARTRICTHWDIK